MIHTAWMAVDTTGGPFDGNIYMAWMHDPVGAVDNSDVFLSYSTDGGLTWAPEVQVAGGTETDQFHPFVEVGGQGTVSIVWYDRRNDPLNNWDIDVYTTFSTDGGVTLQPISQLNDVTFPPVVVGDCYMGEYIAGASDADTFYYAWGDNRNGNPDVYFDQQAIPPLASATPTATPTPMTTPPPPVGGVVMGSDLAELPLESVDQSGSGGRLLMVLAMGAVAAFMALGAAHWYTRRP